MHSRPPFRIRPSHAFPRPCRASPPLLTQSVRSVSGPAVHFPACFERGPAVHLLVVSRQPPAGSFTPPSSGARRTSRVAPCAPPTRLRRPWALLVRTRFIHAHPRPFPVPWAVPLTHHPLFRAWHRADLSPPPRSLLTPAAHELQFRARPLHALAPSVPSRAPLRTYLRRPRLVLDLAAHSRPERCLECGCAAHSPPRPRFVYGPGAHSPPPASFCVRPRCALIPLDLFRA